MKKIDFLGKDTSNLNNSFFKHYLRIKSYSFMQKFSRRACVVYFKNMFEFLNHSKFSKGCVARSLCPIFMIDPSNDSSRWGQQFYNPLFCKSIKNLEIFPKNMLFWQFFVKNYKFLILYLGFFTVNKFFFLICLLSYNKIHFRLDSVVFFLLRFP